jgi:HK97 family phage major capsid protein
VTDVIPETSEQLAEFFNDGAKIAGALKEGKLGDIVNGYVKQQLEAKSGDLPKQLQEQMQLGLQGALQDFAINGGNGLGGLQSPQAQLAREAIARESATVRVANRTMNMRQAASRQKLFNKHAPGAALDADFGADAKAFFQNVIRAKRSPELAKDFAEKNHSVRNAMREGVGSEGGFLVPENLRSQMLMLALENSIARPRARIVPMDSLRVPYPTIDDPTHVGQVYGGIVGYWTEEAAALTASQPTFGRIVLEARKLTAYTEVPNELLEDSIETLDSFIGEVFPEALAYFEDYAFINGDGVGQPLGVLNATSSVSVDRVTSDLVVFQDIVNMFTRMLPQSLNSAVWICSPDVISQLLTLVVGALGSGSGTTAVAPPLWLQSMSAAEGPQYSILGRPLIVSEKVPALGATGDLAFVDWSYYLLGDRQSLQVANSAEYKFQNDITAFRMIERLDGRPWLRSALTPANGSTNTLSPIVTLNATQAS